MIFPPPKHIEQGTEQFSFVDKRIYASKHNADVLDYARLLINSLCDDHGFESKLSLAAERTEFSQGIFIGCLGDELIEEARSQGCFDGADVPNHTEGYYLVVDAQRIIIVGRTPLGVLYALQSLIQLIKSKALSPYLATCIIKDYPSTDFRCIRLYLPGRKNLAFFYRFLSHFVARYKFNKIILEINAGMRFDNHTELNAGWFEFSQDLFNSWRERPVGVGGYYQNSTHHDTADGGVLEKQEVTDLLKHIGRLGIEVIPEVPTLCHTYYMLSRHPELAEVTANEWPDTYCPSLPESYELAFDILDEIIDVFKPKMINIAHDEWRMPINECERCKDKDHTELFVDDVLKVYHYLKEKGIGTAMWCDHLLERIRGEGTYLQEWPSGDYRIPGAISETQVLEKIPKDILLINWMWNDNLPKQGRGEINERDLARWGFDHVYGNLLPDIRGLNYASRIQALSLKGGAVSWWSGTTELNFGKDHLVQFLGCIENLWCDQWMSLEELTKTSQYLAPKIRADLNHVSFAHRAYENPNYNNCSADGVVSPTSFFNETLLCVKDGGGKIDQLTLHSHLAAEPQETAAVSPSCFRVYNNNAGVLSLSVGVGVEGLSQCTAAIPVNQSLNALTFLHACANPAFASPAYAKNYNFIDTNTLLGYYQVLFEDGYCETIPIRYGLQILEKKWHKTWDTGQICYEAEALNIPNTKDYIFAYTWKNSRFGFKINEVKLIGINPIADQIKGNVDENSIQLFGLYGYQAELKDGNFKMDEF